MNHVDFAEACFVKQANPLAQLLGQLETSLQDPTVQQRLLHGGLGAAGGGALGALLGGGKGALGGAVAGGTMGGFSPELQALIQQMMEGQGGPGIPDSVSSGLGDLDNSSLQAYSQGAGPIDSISTRFTNPAADLGIPPMAGGALGQMGLGFDQPSAPGMAAN